MNNYSGYRVIARSKPLSASRNILIGADGARTTILHITATSSGAGIWEGTMDPVNSANLESSADWFPLPSITLQTAIAAVPNLPGATITPTDDDVLCADNMGARHVRFRRTAGTATGSVSLAEAPLAEISASAGGGGDASAANQLTQITALQLIDDAVFTDDTTTHTPGTTKGLSVGFVADETSADSVNEGDIGMARMTLDRRLRIERSNGALLTPSLDSYTTVAISAAANTADQVLKTAPGANKQIWVYHFSGTADTADGSIAVQDEDNAVHSGVMEISRRGGVVLHSNEPMFPIWKVATNKALEIDTVTCGFKGSLGYAIVSV